MHKIDNRVEIPTRQGRAASGAAVGRGPGRIPSSEARPSESRRPRFQRAIAIVNTRSGNHDEARLRRVLDAYLGAAGVEWKLVLREKGQSRRDLTREALEQGFQLVAAAGGDGTVAKVADVLAGTDAVLGVLPTGTGNLLARELGVPMNLDDAARLLGGSGRVREIDGMEVNETRRCFSHVSMGTYSRIASLTTPDDKRLLGRFAYLQLLLREVSAERSWRYRLTIDGRLLHVRASLVLAANIGASGLPGVRWREGVSPDDGRIDVCVLRARTPAEYLQLIGSALFEQQEYDPRIDYYSAEKTLRIESSADLPLRGDGKEIGTGGADIKVLPRTVRVLVRDAEASEA